MTDSSENNSFEILGQRIPLPSSVPGVVAWASLCATLVLVTYILAVLMPEPRFEKLVGAFQSHYYNSKGEVVESPKKKLVSFWTPSEKTLDSIKRYNSRPVNPDETWQDAPPGKLEDFERKLVELGVPGWRRYPVVGRGRVAKKDGWWWTTTVDSDFNTAELAKMYAGFWNTGDERIYVEEISGSAVFHESGKP